MTLIVGILCEDGVAIASDKQATGGALVLKPGMMPQATQTSTSRVTKVSQIGNDLLLGVSGVPAIGAEYQRVIENKHPNFATRGFDLATNKLKEDIREIIEPRIQIAKLSIDLIGHSNAWSEATCECVVAGSFKDEPVLFQILQQGGFDRATSEIPYRVIGSGQMAADPFIKYLRNTFWPDRPPSVAEGVLAAYWAIHYAIEVGAPMVGPPIDAYKLERVGKRLAAVKVAADELKQHDDFIRAARDAMREMSSVKVSDTTPADASQVPTLDKSASA